MAQELGEASGLLDQQVPDGRRATAPGTRLSISSVPRRERPHRDTHRDLILDLAAHVPLGPHRALAPHHAREEELLGNGHPGEEGSKQGLQSALA